LEQYADPAEMAQANQFALTIAANQGLPVVEAGMVSEGGDREFNSKGTMITIKTTEMQRNPGMTTAQLEAKYKSLLGVKKVVWLDEGLATDGLSNDTIWPGPDGQKDAIAFGAGHMDEMARFADDHIVLLALVTKEEAQKSAILAEDRKRLEKNYDILKFATDQSGKPFTIIRVPEAELVYYKLEKKDDIYDWFQGMEYLDGSTFPATGPVYEVAATSYMNFIISNGVIVLPQYWEQGKSDIIKQKDAQAMAIMKSVFPGRQIVGVDPLAYNIGSGGGMHCSFQQEPATSH
jgi:agmatine deiminase